MGKAPRKTTDEKIDDLARMVKKGFDDLTERMATKEDIHRLENRLEKIEFNTNTHERRIEILEDQMRIVSTKLGLRK